MRQLRLVAFERRQAGLEAGDFLFQAAGGVVDALDRGKAQFQLFLVLDDLRFEGRHDDFQPGAGVVVGVGETAAHARGDGVEEFFHQHDPAGGQQGRRAELLVIHGFDVGDLLAVAGQRKRHRRGQCQAVFGGEFAVHHVHHFRDLGRLAFRTVQVTGDALEVLAHGLAQAREKAAALHGRAHAIDIVAHDVHAQARVQLRRQAGKHGARRLQLEQAAVEFLLLDIDAPHHVGDHALVLAAQAVQLVQLLGDAARARRRLHLLRRFDGVQVERQLAPDDVLARGDQLLEQGRLQRLQAALFQQRRIVVDLAHQGLLRRDGKHLASVQRQQMRHAGLLALDGLRHLGVAAQFIPHAVDLVEHHQASRAGADMVAPDLDVAARDARVGRQNKQHRMRIRDQVQGQFRFRADGVQAGRIEDDQALFQQRMGEVDDGVAPHGNFHLAVFVQHGGSVRVVGVVQAVARRFFHADFFRQADLADGFLHVAARIDVQGQDGPGGGQVAVVAGRQVLRARLDGQQADRWRPGGVVQQLGGAHGGAARARGQDALAIAGKEDGVDQLGFAARKFRHEGDR